MSSTMARPCSILFLSHAASRNGASVLLLHLLQWLRANVDFELEVFSQGGGPLLADFRDVARTHVAPASAWPRADRPAWQSTLQARMLAPLLRARLHRRPDLVYANTAAAWSQVATLGRADVPLLWHVHELPYALALSLPTAAAAGLLRTATRVIAVSDAVRDALVRDHALDRRSIDVVNGFVAPPRLSGPAVSARRAELRAELGWPADAVVVGGCGGPGWRKGSDLFLQAARQALEAVGQGATTGARPADGLARDSGVPPLRFLWVGGEDGSIEALQFDHDLRVMGLAGSIRRLRTTGNVEAAYAAMDLFALTSREDPFPLVVLEAAGHGVPTVTFASAGGAAEFVGGSAGLVVPYLDLSAFALSLVELYRSPALRAALGEAARRKVGAQNRVQTQGPLLLSSMRRCLARDAVVG